jgi:hypothetical protein
MAARQYGFSMSQVMNLGLGITSNTEANKIISALIIAAYGMTRYGSHEMQLKSTEEFRDAVYLKCIKGSVK